MTTPHGVRKVSEDIFMIGRTLIVTETDDTKIDYSNLPDGTIRINPADGSIYVKLTDSTTWSLGVNMHPRLWAGTTAPTEPGYGDLWINVAEEGTNNGIPVLSWYGGSSWQDITADALKVTNNLSDLSDIDTALQNLGLWGNDVETHFHDDHYLPMFETQLGTNTAAIAAESSRAETAEANLQTELNTEITNRTNGDSGLQNQINGSSNQNSIQAQINAINASLLNLNSAVNNAFINIPTSNVGGNIWIS